MKPAGAPVWLDELPLQTGPPWLSMGTRSLHLDRWLITDGNFGSELELKATLLRERPTEVIATLPGSEAGSQEAFDLVAAWLADRQHERAACSPDLHPIDAAGRLVQEDLCLVEERDGAWIMTAGSVCFPSHWRIHEKLGHSVASIHAPVHHYDDELRARVDNFFARLRVDRPVWRRNVSIHNHDDLFRPEPHETQASFEGVTQLWLRSEYQTLRRLPRSGGVLFTIKTQQCDVDRLRHRPDIAYALGAKLAALEPELERRGEAVPFPAWLPATLADF